MEYILDILSDFVFEFALGATKNKDLPKLYRYMIVIFIWLLFILIIGGLFTVGIIMFNKSWAVGLFCILISLILLLCLVYKFILFYQDRLKSKKDIL